MTVITLMAQALDQELRARGILVSSKADCEAIMRSVIERSGKIAASLPPSERSSNMGKPT